MVTVFVRDEVTGDKGKVPKEVQKVLWLYKFERKYDRIELVAVYSLI